MRIEFVGGIEDGRVISVRDDVHAMYFTGSDGSFFEYQRIRVSENLRQKDGKLVWNTRHYFVLLQLIEQFNYTEVHYLRKRDIYSVSKYRGSKEALIEISGVEVRQAKCDIVKFLLQSLKEKFK